MRTENSRHSFTTTRSKANSSAQHKLRHAVEPIHWSRVQTKIEFFENSCIAHETMRKNESTKERVTTYFFIEHDYDLYFARFLMTYFLQL